MTKEEFLKLTPKKRASYLGKLLKEKIQKVTAIEYTVPLGSTTYTCYLNIEQLKIKVTPGFGYTSTDPRWRRPSSYFQTYGKYHQLGTYLTLMVFFSLGDLKLDPWLQEAYEYYESAFLLMGHTFYLDDPTPILDWEG